MKTGRSFWVVLAFLFVASGQVVAQESIDAKVQRLEETIKNLEARVASLETQLHGNSAPVTIVPAPGNVVPAPGSPPAGKENWRQLHKGMKEAEVKQLLGSPTRIVPFTYSVHWFYGKAYVDFDQSHRVQDWHEPN